MPGPPVYGQTRKRREEVTYAQIERAATDILKTGVRPTLEGLRKTLGGGSPRTLLDGLNRYWRDLGNQVAGSPDTLRRLPAAVADLAEGVWQRALSLAVDAAQATSSESEEQLSRLKSQLELRQHTLSQREVELDGLLRSRERTVKELEEHLRVAISMLSKRDATIRGLESRLDAAQVETDDYRQRLGKVVHRAVTRHQATAPRNRSKPEKKPARLRKPSRAKKLSRKRSGKRR
jgi:septal ring factor EnvC (AmiA/AmiB activator)